MKRYSTLWNELCKIRDRYKHSVTKCRLMSLLKRLKAIRLSDVARTKLLTAMILGIFALAVVSVAVTPAAAAGDDVTSWYGLTVVDWLFVGLTVGMFIAFLLMKNVFLLYGSIIMAVAVIAVMIFGY